MGKLGNTSIDEHYYRSIECSALLLYIVLVHAAQSVISHGHLLQLAYRSASQEYSFKNALLKDLKPLGQMIGLNKSWPLIYIVCVMIKQGGFVSPFDLTVEIR